MSCPAARILDGVLSVLQLNRLFGFAFVLGLSARLCLLAAAFAVCHDKSF